MIENVDHKTQRSCIPDDIEDTTVKSLKNYSTLSHI